MKIAKKLSAFIVAICSGVLMSFIAVGADDAMILGDINGDKEVDTSDVAGILSWVVNDGVGSIDETVADYDQNGVVNALDASRMMFDYANNFSDEIITWSEVPDYSVDLTETPCLTVSSVEIDYDDAADAEAIIEVAAPNMEYLDTFDFTVDFGCEQMIEIEKIQVNSNYTAVYNVYGQGAAFRIAGFQNRGAIVDDENVIMTLTFSINSLVHYYEFTGAMDIEIKPLNMYIIRGGADVTNDVDIENGAVIISEKPSTDIQAVTGDANNDGQLNVRDCAFIASMLAQGIVNKLPMTADYNNDGVVNVRDAAAMAKFLAEIK